jgi:hypothetical protein
MKHAPESPSVVDGHRPHGSARSAIFRLGSTMCRCLCALLINGLAVALIGMTITVLVAWACIGLAHFPPRFQYEYAVTQWPVDVPESWPQPHVAREARGIGWRWSGLETKFTLPMQPEFHLCTIANLSSGWPFPALMAETRSEHRSTGQLHAAHPPSPWVSGIDYPLQQPRGFPWKRLPIMPIWRGFVANSVLYAAVTWVVIASVGAAFVRLRTAIRSRKGRCSQCDYPLTGLPKHDGCPECGSAQPCRE